MGLRWVDLTVRVYRTVFNQNRLRNLDRYGNNQGCHFSLICAQEIHYRWIIYQFILVIGESVSKQPKWSILIAFLFASFHDGGVPIVGNGWQNQAHVCQQI